jgi:hypothetical protein
MSEVGGKAFRLVFLVDFPQQMDPSKQKNLDQRLSVPPVSCSTLYLALGRGKSEALVEDKVYAGSIKESICYLRTQG